MVSEFYGFNLRGAEVWIGEKFLNKSFDLMFFIRDLVPVSTN